MVDIIQLSPEEKVNGADEIPRREASRYTSRIFRVTGTNQNARKLLFTDFVNTKYISSAMNRP